LRLIPTQIAVEEEQKAVSKAELARAKLDLERTKIVLPFDARIAETSVEITQYVRVGQTLAVADSLDTAEIEAQVPIAHFQALVRAIAGDSMPEGIVPETLGRIVRELGFSVTVHLRSGSGATSWEGRFARISDTIDPETRTIGVIAAVDDNYAKARPGERPPLTKGLFVEVEIRAKPLEGRLIVPRASLREDQLLVMNAEDRLEIRAVEPELFQGDIVAIGEGLVPGERVVVSDLVPTVEGMLLNAREDAALAASLRAKAAATEQLK
jgi:RND family efflux transporter MFP subunit